MKELIIGIVLLLLGCLFLYLPVIGFAYLYLGEFALGLLHLLPLLCLIGVLLYRHYVIEPQKTHIGENERQKKLEARRTEEVRRRARLGDSYTLSDKGDHDEGMKNINVNKGNYLIPILCMCVFILALIGLWVYNSPIFEFERWEKEWEKVQ